MGKPAPRAGFVTERDQRLFQFLFESKVATSHQMIEKIFDSTNQQAAYRRIAKLAKAGWLAKHGFSDEKIPKNIFNLTEKAYRRWVLQEEVNNRRVQLSSEVIGHDLVLVDIRRYLERRPTVRRFITENYLQSYYELADSSEFRDLIELRSDAVIELILQEKYRFFVPVEYEASQKTSDRNQKKLLDYYIKYDGNTVLFICGNSTILNALAEADLQISQEFKPKLYFATLADVQAATEKLTFVSSNREKRVVL